MTTAAAHHRVASGHLHRVHRGVYAVGHARLGRDGRFLAAVLACGRGAVLSHRSAAALFDIRASDRTVVDVTIPKRQARSRAGIRVHTAKLLPRDLTAVNGLPCTSWARTLLDLARELDPRGVERAIERTEILRLYNRAALDDVLERNPTHRGALRLRFLIASRPDEPAPIRSELERRLRELCAEASLPSSIANATLFLDCAPIEVDFLWPAERLVVEVDGAETHATSTAFERDRYRDQRLTLAGYRVLRFTWRQVAREPERVATTIAGLLGSAPVGPGP